MPKMYKNSGSNMFFASIYYLIAAISLIQTNFTITVGIL